MRSPLLPQGDKEMNGRALFPQTCLRILINRRRGPRIANRPRPPRATSFDLKRTMPPKKNKKKAKAPSPPPDLNGAPVAAAPAAQAEAEQPAADKVAASPLQCRR